ncbi:2Fe-2S iron-sulfur cluster binding domain-containing protein [Mariprofundus erugo]|uniref:2Fe-2S iron-sulfur cluster binding domain-containing protein n=2 Tax=Mariprofundus erugo TaxID=2528639 RepID=A0A5R9GS34_9PROT|nr:2Fe-2S iron-sulfur cluster-binding protein [Mariprofundus erugo]TLS67243.1 2Fe-2S iron-sulfur cluster binding domain-containing protein [Mariprofundus erugo]
MDGKHIFVAPDQMDPALSLRDLLAGCLTTLPGECGGAGKCGCCLVAIVAGECSGLTPAEQSMLVADEISCGWRLACQAIPEGEVELIVIGREDEYTDESSRGACAEP